MSYKTEQELNRYAKVGSILILFSSAIVLVYSLFNHFDPKQYELGYLTIFIISTLMVLNVVLTLNPIARDDTHNAHDRQSCCSNQNLLLSISCVFVLQILEVHNLMAATPE
eukprot:CAMPEP_0170496638 /NCGR_PEP_ID=MMETSP0208-20121228/22276_1 /TAXON_ID=197538 /ORGANISM="Strombidium inclinatum, Strain S3" /LENGTH=110 /DNA_ID=CAMNT_0010773239 /DNA_START=1341 /DNA_END=1673 /DNA_ORIENTATION=+